MLNRDSKHLLTEKLRTNLIPAKVGIDLTRRCNLRCMHCYLNCDTPSNAKTQRELSTEEICNLLRQLAQIGTFMIEFSGGEPLLRKDIVLILQTASRLGFHLTLSTNGTLLDAKTARELKILCVNVFISIYSSHSHIHDQIVGEEGAFARTQKAISLCKHERIRLVLRTTYMQINIHELENIHTMASNLGAECGSGCYIFPDLMNLKDISTFRLTDKQLQKKGPKIARSWSRRPEATCGAGRTSAWISSFGDVFPCALLRKRCGNVRDQSFSNIWRRSNKLNTIRGISLKDMKSCFTCSLKENCPKCIAANLTETGNLTTPSPETCRITNYAIYGQHNAI